MRFQNMINTDVKKCYCLICPYTLYCFACFCFSRHISNISSLKERGTCSTTSVLKGIKATERIEAPARLLAHHNMSPYSTSVGNYLY